MLAGYLPFDDDPANPEGDNINLLYKYIVSTPLTFPEYVTPHARDLLRRILVPNPRKRADLFEVARHSWLAEYAHVVEFITSSTTSPSEVQNSSSPPREFAEHPGVARSASVRETPKQKAPPPTAVGGLAKAHAMIDQEAEQTYRTPKDANVERSRSSTLRLLHEHNAERTRMSQEHRRLGTTRTVKRKSHPVKNLCLMNLPIHLMATQDPASQTTTKLAPRGTHETNSRHASDYRQWLHDHFVWRKTADGRLDAVSCVHGPPITRQLRTACSTDHCRHQCSRAYSAAYERR